MRNILKAFLKTGVGSVVTMFLSVIMAKIFAVVLGPSGSGLYSLVRQFILTATIGSTLGGDTALVQGIAVKKGREREQYLSTVLWLFAIGGLFVGILVALFAPYLCSLVFSTDDPQTISLVRWLAVPIVLSTVLAYINSVLNGFRAIGRLALGQVLSVLISAVISYPVAIYVSSGYFTAFIWLFSLSMLVGIMYGLLILRKEGWLKLIWHGGLSFDSDSFRHFYGIAGTTLITGLFSTGVMLAIRVFVVRQDGLAGAGIFNVAWTLSMTYVMLILSSFGTYYLPTLSGINDKPAKHELMNNVLRIAIIAVIPLVVSVVVFKPLIIKILYTEQFSPALKVVRWMLIGDYLKVVSWVLGMSIIAYADMRVFFWKEVVWWLGILGGTALSIEYFGSIELIGAAYAALYAINLCYLLYYVYKKHEFSPCLKAVLTWFGGLVLICLVSYLTWNSVVINWFWSIFWCLLAVIFSVSTITGKEWRKIILFLRNRKISAGSV